MRNSNKNIKIMNILNNFTLIQLINILMINLIQKRRRTIPTQLLYNHQSPLLCLIQHSQLRHHSISLAFNQFNQLYIHLTITHKQFKSFENILRKHTLLTYSHLKEISHLIHIITILYSLFIRDTQYLP
jgi:hypothetical protein